MKSFRTPDFRACYSKLPANIQATARKNYRLWLQDPQHPGLEFKRVGKIPPVWSVRIGIGWRALGIVKDEEIVWFWIGSHAQYDKLLKQ